MGLQIGCEWTTATHGSPEVRETAAQLEIGVGDFVATRAENEWSASVTDRPVLSAYPLALWFAANWWRLRFEAAPATEAPPAAWRMSHEMPAAGHGFIWPGLRFDSDGQTMHLRMQRTPASRVLSLRYLSDFEAWASLAEYEQVVSPFVEKVCHRLIARGLPETELSLLWAELGEERSGQDSREYRRVEAELGNDPGEGPEPTIQRLLNLRHEIGLSTVHEVAHACAGDAAEERLSALLRCVSSDPDLRGRDSVMQIGPLAIGEPAWKVGYQAAATLRTSCGMDRPVVSDHVLGELVGISATAVAPAQPDPQLPLSVMVRHNSNILDVHLRRRTRPARRFELARLIGDLILGPREPWMVATDHATARQKAQRAFAAELLCPRDELKIFVGSDLSDDNIVRAGEYFGVSQQVVRLNLENAGIIATPLV